MNNNLSAARAIFNRFKWHIGTLLSMLIVQSTSGQDAYPDPDFTAYFRNETGWQAGDATISVALPDGTALWLFGDSYVNQGYDPDDMSLPCLPFVSNAICTQNMTAPGPIAYHSTLDHPVQDYYYWPGKGFYYNNKVYIFWLERSYVRNNQGQIVGSTFVSSKCAELSYPDLDVLAIHNISNPLDIEFGKAAYVDQSGGWLYVYGSKNVSGFNRYYVSRCPLNNLFQSWQYWNGVLWGAAPNAGNHIQPAGTAVGSASFSVFPYEGSYYLLSQDNGFLVCGNETAIKLYKSSSPRGPFVLHRLVYNVADSYNDVILASYNAQAHPEFGGDLLISYNVNDVEAPAAACPSQCSNGGRFHADTYRPKFVRLPLSALPIELLSFEARMAGTQIRLNWITETEVRNQYFEVERSADGTDFSRIGKVKGAGNSNSQQRYEWIDPSPLPGKSYYRIRQVDEDGQFSYSPLAAVQNNASYSAIYPNPVQEGKFVIQVGKQACEEMTLLLYHLNGSLVFRYAFAANPASEIPVQLPENLSTGIYMAQISCDQHTKTFRLSIE